MRMATKFCPLCGHRGFGKRCMSCGYPEEATHLTEQTIEDNERLAAENAALRAQLAEMRGRVDAVLTALDNHDRTEEWVLIYKRELRRALGRPECAADTTGEEREGR